MLLQVRLGLIKGELNLKEKPWMIDFTTITLINCPACGHMVRPGYPVCSNCKAIVNKELAEKMKIEFAR